MKNQDRLRTLRSCYIVKKDYALCVSKKFAGAVIDSCGKKGKTAWVEDFVSVWNRYMFSADQDKFDQYMKSRLQNPKLSAYAFAKPQIEELSKARREKEKIEQDQKESLRKASYVEFLEHASSEQQRIINPAESQFKKLLDAAGYEYEYQKVIMLDDEKGIIADFYVEKEKLIFEVDGFTHDAAKDFYRDLQLLNKYGIVVVRYRSSQVNCATVGELREVVAQTREWYDEEYKAMEDVSIARFLPAIRGTYNQTITRSLGYLYDEKTDGLKLVSVAINTCVDTNSDKYEIVKKVREEIRKSKKKAA